MEKKFRIKNILNRETRTLSDSSVSVGDIIEVEEIVEIERPKDSCSCGQCELDPVMTQNIEKSVEECEHHYDDNDVCEFCGDMKKCPSDDCTCDFCTDDRQEIASLPASKETLVDRFNGCDMKYVTPEQLAIIAKVYYQAHPEEIPDLSSLHNEYKTRCLMLQDKIKGMISIKEVKKILFQDSKSLFSYDKWWFDRDSVREAIEKLEE